MPPIQLSDDDYEEKKHTSYPDEIEVRMEKVSQLYLKAHSPIKIAELLKVNLTIVKADLARLRRRWIENSQMNFQKRLAQELARLDNLEAVAWQAYEKSTLPGKTKTKRTEYGKPMEEKPNVLDKANQKRNRKDRPANQDGRTNKVVNLTEKNYKGLIPIRMVEELKKVGQSGDPKYLEIILKCMENRARICGLFKSEDQDKPTQVVVIPWAELMGGHGGPQGMQGMQGVQDRDRDRVNLIELNPNLNTPINDEDIEDIIQKAGDE